MTHDRTAELESAAREALFFIRRMSHRIEGGRGSQTAYLLIMERLRAALDDEGIREPKEEEAAP